MSINIDTNKVTRFGKNLPTPYIDSVEIYDEYMTLKCSLYFQKPLAVNEDAYQDYVDNTLNDINICATILPRGDAYAFGSLLAEDKKERFKIYKKFVINEKFDATTAMLLRNASAIDFLRLENEQVNNAYFVGEYYETPLFPMSNNRLFSYLVQGNIDNSTQTSRRQLIFLFPKNETDRTKTLLYDSVGNPVERIMLSRNIYYGETNSDYSVGIHEGAVTEYEDRILDAVDLFLFTTSLNSTTTTSGYELFETEFDYSIDDFSNEALTGLYNNQISDVTYEQISADNVYKTANVIVYKAPDNTTYVGPTPIQAVDALYYGASSITLPAIVEQLRGIMGTSTDKTVQDAYDNINYILETSGQQSNLLLRLNEYRKTFPETSTAVPAGRFYEVFERTLFNINNEVKRNLLLAKVINSNPIVKDYRTPAVLELDPFTDPAKKTPETDINEYIYLSVNPGYNPFIGGRYGVYGAYGDPNTVVRSAFEADEENILEIRKYSRFADVENSADVTRKLKAFSNEIQQDLINLGIGVLERLGESLTNNDLKRTIGDGYAEYGGDPALGIAGFGAVAVAKVETNQETIMSFKSSENKSHKYKTITEIFEHYGLTMVGTIRMAGEDLNTEEGPGTGYGTYKEVPGTDEFKDDRKRVFQFNFNSDPDLSFIDYPKEGYEIVASGPGQGNNSDTLNLGSKFIGVESKDVKELQELYNTVKINLNVYEAVLGLSDKIDYTTIQSLNHYLFGYWFFDFEKSLRNNTTISKVYSVERLENRFGRFFVQDKYSFKNTEITRYAFTRDYLAERAFAEDGSWKHDDANFDKPTTYEPFNGSGFRQVGKMTSLYSGDGSRAAYSIIHDTNIISLDDTFLPTLISVDQENPSLDFREITDGVDIAENSKKEYTYCILRPFVTPGDKEFGSIWSTPDNKTLNGYRLACFEHQEVFDTAEKDGYAAGFWSDMYRSFYTYKVTLTDNTAKIYYELVSYFKNLFEGEFQSYYDAAFEQCSYDNINERFNDFFITGILDTYDTQISTAPWYLMPVVYHTHRDLIYNEYKGDKDLIFAAAHRDTQNIAPETGNLASLELFRNSIQTFYDDLYGDGGTLHQRVVDDLGYDSTTSTSELLQKIEDGSGFKEIVYGKTSPVGTSGELKSTWYDIPPIINLDETYAGVVDDATTDLTSTTFDSAYNLSTAIFDPVRGLPQQVTGIEQAGIRIETGAAYINEVSAAGDGPGPDFDLDSTD